MEYLKKIFVAFFILFSVLGFTTNFVKADALDDFINWFLETPDLELEPVVENETPLKKARKELQKYDKWTYFMSLVDNLVATKSTNKQYLQWVSNKVKSFDLSKYYSPIVNKDLTLKAVISYIDALLDETIAKL